MPRNPYSQPPNRYGGMQGPTGLGGFLSRQPAISQRQIDPATGFPARPQSYGAVMGRPDFGSIGRNASKGKSGSKGGAKTVKSPDQRQPQPTAGAVRAVEHDRPHTRLSDIGTNPYGTQIFKIDPDMLDRGTAMNPAYRSPADQAAPHEGQLANSRATIALADRPGLTAPPPPTEVVQGFTEKLKVQSQGPESLAGKFQTHGPTNIRPVMSVGKATGGPVGLASLIGRY